MKVILAKNAGFCMGVRRAVDTTLDMIPKADNGIATFGPLIHNPQVLDLLRERGVRILDTVPEKESGTVVIRAHGVPPEKKSLLEASGAQVKDATCPRVVKVQVIISKYRKKGFQTVIIGDRNHAEVEGLMGYAGTDVQVVSNEKDIKNLQLEGPYIIVSQTTQDEKTFEKISEVVLGRFPGGKVFNTICDSTHNRQEEVRNLCKEVQAMVVVGGRTSANTQRLGEIAESMGCPVFMVENEDDLDMAALAKYNCVGVTAGASTPTWMINWVVRTLEALPAQNEGCIRPFLAKLFWLFLATNLYVGLAGGLLAYTCALLQEITPEPGHFLIAFGYIFAMHNMNRFTDQKSKKINDPMRAIFYQNYRWPLLIASSIMLATALTLAHGMGKMPFWLLVAMSLLGVLYSVRFIPKPLSLITRVRGLKEIPGSRAFFVATAWAFVTVLIPALGHPSPDKLNGWVLLFALLLVYVRNALFDVFEVQGDRIVGKETLPVFIGKKGALKVLHLIMGLLLVMLVALPLAGQVSKLAWWLIPGVLYLSALVLLYEKGPMPEGARLEFCLETVFVCVSVLAWFGHAMSGTT